jgi:DNA modification methylase
MAKQYKGSLTLDWYNKQKAILLRTEEEPKVVTDIPAPRINWINKDEALFFEINEQEGKGIAPFWVDRNDIRVKEARPLIFQAGYKAISKDKEGSLPGMDSVYKVEVLKQDDSTIENILIKGDNLLALNILKKIFDNKPEEEKAKCVFTDPPYNTGSAFEHYDDNLVHSEWLTLFRDRLVGLKHIMQEGAFIFVQLDDSEGAYGKLLMDETFGASNFIITMYVQVRYDEKTLKEDMKFNKLIEQIHIYRKNSNEKFDINRQKIEYTNDKFNVSIKELSEPFETVKLGGKRVDIFQDGTYSVDEVEPSRKGLKEIWASGGILDGNSSGRFFRDYISGREKTDGYKTLYKVYDIGDDGIGFRYFSGPKRENATRGKYFQGMPLNKQENEENFKFVPVSNFIDLAAYFGNCRHEGGVEFKSGKKPEILIAKLIELATSPGDLVIDIFGGSGSTFAVAHKMNRKWIGVEIGKQADTHIVKRLVNVISGKDQTGISKEFQWKGGGSFKYYHLGESIIKLNEDGTGDFNWKLGKEFIQESFLSSYDYIQDTLIDFQEGQLFGDKKNQPIVGVQTIGNKVRIAVITLNEPDGKLETLSYEEMQSIYKTVKKKYSPEYINIFTNRGIEIAYDSKPDDLEVVKIPNAIFSELEK